MAYNKTQLTPETTFNSCVYQRDHFAHYLRWAYVLREAKIGMNILDFGCGSAELLKVFYKNLFRPKRYLGLDIREAWKNNKEKYFDNWSLKPEFNKVDLCDQSIWYGKDWDIICSFEVIEHIGKSNIDKFLKNIYNHMNKNTVLLISTPCYDEKVGAAANHIIDGEIGELTYDEMNQALINHGFIIDKVFGTFASQKDYKHLMSNEQKAVFEHLNQYYDSNLMSVLMAPMFPMESRNCIWRCRLK